MKFFVAGSDARQQYLHTIVKEKHEEMVRFVNDADAVLLPVAQTGRYEKEIAAYLKEGAAVYGYAFSEEFIRKCCEINVRCMDYRNYPKFMKTNSTITAEGVIAEAISISPLMLQESKCLVIGYGNCGKVIVEKLKMLRAKVYIMEKNRENLHKRWDVDYIINTAPELVVTETMIKALPKDAVILDIASNGVGVDWNAAARYKLLAKHCPALPDRYGAKTMATIMYEIAVSEYHIMKKRT